MLVLRMGQSRRRDAAGRWGYAVRPVSWKKWPFPFLAGLVLGALLVWAVLAGPWRSPEADLEHYREVRDFAKSAFVREVSDDALLSSALHGLADGLDDYSQYFDAEEARLLQRETSGRYFGLGVVLERPFSKARILFPLAGGPAAAAGVRVGDRIVAIDGRPVGEIDEAAFKKIVSGSEPHDVELVLAGLDGVERALVVRTAEVVEPTVKHERILDRERGVGYLAITSFSRETPDEFRDALARLKADGMSALVIDLRGNPGGVLVAAVDVARAFVHEGLIVSTEGRGEPVRHVAEPGKSVWRGLPLAVLVDEGSASASEVLAAALQEHRAAVLVGAPTFGKGLVQSLHRFGDPGPVLKVSTSYYYTPSHANLEHSADPSKPRGIQPDLLVELPPAEREEVRMRLLRASPAREYAAALEAWERESGEKVVPEIPIDAQVRAALDLFAGTRPDPSPRRRAP